MGLSNERSLGKPSIWMGEDAGFEDFQLTSVNWLSGLPGDSSGDVAMLLVSFHRKDKS